MHNIPVKEKDLKEGEFYFYTSFNNFQLNMHLKQPPTSIVLLIKILDAKWGNKYYKFYNFVWGCCYDHYHIGGITLV